MSNPLIGWMWMENEWTKEWLYLQSVFIRELLTEHNIIESLNLTEGPYKRTQTAAHRCLLRRRRITHGATVHKRLFSSLCTAAHVLGQRYLQISAVEEPQ